MQDVKPVSISSGIHTSLNGVIMRIFRIFSVESDRDFVRECDLEYVLCGACHGALRKESREESEYYCRESFLLRCQKCGGSYTATSLTNKEVSQLSYVR